MYHLLIYLTFGKMGMVIDGQGHKNGLKLNFVYEEN